MKKVRKLLAIALTAATLCTLLTACGGKDVSGTYTQTINSKTYFQSYIPRWSPRWGRGCAPTWKPGAAAPS